MNAAQQEVRYSYRGLLRCDAFEAWFNAYGHWIYESRAEAWAAWERGLQ